MPMSSELLEQAGTYPVYNSALALCYISRMSQGFLQGIPCSVICFGRVMLKVGRQR